MSNESFNQRLSVDDRLKTLQALGWSKLSKYNADPEGWITNINDKDRGWQFSVNIQTGTVTDHQNGYSMDIVDLVWCYAEYMAEIEPSRPGAIKWIKQALGINSGSPELNGKVYAKKHLKKGSGNHYVQLPVAVLRSDLSMSAKLVWADIFERCGGDKNSSWASTTKISRDLHISRRTVLRAITELEEKGYLVLKRRSGSKSVMYPVIPTSDK